MNNIIKNYYKFLKKSGESTRIKVKILNKVDNSEQSLEYDHTEFSGMDAILDSFNKINIDHKFNAKIRRKPLFFRIILKTLNFLLFLISAPLKEYNWKFSSGEESVQVYGLLGEEYSQKMSKYCKENNIPLYCFFFKCINNSFGKVFLKDKDSTRWLLPIIYEKNNDFKIIDVLIKRDDSFLKYYNKIKWKIIFSTYYESDLRLLMFSIKFLSKKIKKSVLLGKKTYFASYSYFGKSMTKSDYTFYGITPSSNLCKLTVCAGTVTGQFVIGIDIHKSISNINITSEEIIDQIKKEIDHYIK
jgi:hypothetical protein